MIRSRTRRRWRRRLIRPSRLSMTAGNHQRERRQRPGGDKPASLHGLGASFGGGGGGGGVAVLRACSSIRCASLCSSTAAARKASDPFRRTSGTTSSLMYFTTLRRSDSRCVAASLNCCSHFGFGSSVGIRTPRHDQLDDVKNAGSTSIADDSTHCSYVVTIDPGKQERARRNIRNETPDNLPLLICVRNVVRCCNTLLHR
jgi:hypothetical protein